MKISGIILAVIASVSIQNAAADSIPAGEISADTPSADIISADAMPSDTLPPPTAKTGTAAEEKPFSGRDFNVRHIGYDENLSSQRVFSIVEDNCNAMWISTKAGIDRYNGREMTNYTLPGDLYYGDKAGMRIWLQYDCMDRLWAYIHSGRIYRYSVAKDCFEEVFDLKKLIGGDIILNYIYIDPEGRLWAGLAGGLYRLDEGNAVKEIIRGEYINCITQVGEYMYAGTSDGIIRFRSQEPDRYEVILEGMMILSLLYDEDKDRIWAGTFNKGLWSVDPASGRTYAEDLGTAVQTNPVRALTEYDSRTILAGVDGGGVYSIDKDTGKSVLSASTGEKSGIALKGNGIYAVTKDHEGNLWIGSYTGGVSLATIKNNAVDTYSHVEENRESLADSNVNGVAENAGGDLWFATDNGISILHRDSSSWTHGLEMTVAMTFCCLGNGNVWTGTYGNGIYLLSPEGKILRHLTHENGELTTNYIFAIASDPEGNLWAGGLEGDLQKLDRNGNPLQTFGIKWVNSIQYAGGGKMGVATVDGLWMVDIRTGEAEVFASSGEFMDRNVSAYIISALFNGDGTVWLGTEGGGLNLYSMEDRSVKTYTSEDGLPSDDVFSVQKDSSGRIWVSTGRGIAILDKGKILTVNYIQETDKEYNKSSFAALSDSRFIYGSSDGAVCISPETIRIAEYDAPLRFTRLNVEYASPEEAARLNPEIHGMIQDGTVRLDYSWNTFTVNFESINYGFRQDIVYRHKLDGYERDWNAPSGDGSVRYTNVSPGRYTLMVRSLRNSDGSIITEKNLEIRIGQPWWNSWYAWAGYIMIAGIMLYFAVRYKGNQMQKKYDEDKIRFFIDTAHNIRTPVTLIMAPLEDLAKDTALPEKARYCLDLARANTDKLYNLISKLLEFERSDISRRHVELAPVDLTKIFTDEAATFLSDCEKRQITLKVSSPEDNIFVLADRHLVEIICDNLLSNAFKYSKPHGTVEFSLSHDSRYAVIKVRDHGIGIPEKDRKHIFKDVHRAGNAIHHEAMGTGFGLLMVSRVVKKLGGKITFTSEEGKGSEFTVTLRLTAPAPSGTADGTASVPASPVPGTTVQEHEIHDSGVSRETILIVEDHDTLRQYLRRIFEQEYDVADASGGEEAVAYLKKSYPDIILSDLMMPGIQGDDLCRMVKDDPDTSGIPFILLTAKAGQDSLMDSLRKGADDYIQKPFKPDILKQKVRGFLENRKRMREFFLREALKQAGSADASEGVREEVQDNTISESDRQFVHKATETVLVNISDPEFNINSLCHEMAMSRTLFYSRIKSLTGQGPQEFIRLIRLQKAAEYLEKGMNVADVSVETGFVNAKYFSTLFKKQFGVQPSRYTGEQRKCLESNQD